MSAMTKAMGAVQVITDREGNITWRRSSAADGHCVEVAFVDENVLVRDSKAEEPKPFLRIDNVVWQKFLDQLKWT